MSVTIVYRHTNKINGKSYIGRTCQKLTSRWRGGKGYTGQKKFARAIQKYGWDNFTHDLLAFCKTEEDGIKVETFFKEMFNTIKNGYNIVLEEDKSPMLGQKHTEETKHSWSKKRKGRKLTEEHKKNISAGLTGRQQTPETRKKVSEAHSGRKHSDQSKRNMSESHKGKKMSEEAKQKLSESNKGRVVSTETREKIGNANRGRKLSKASKENMSAAHKGKVSEKRKLTFEIAEEIRTEYGNGGITMKALSVKHNVSRATIGDIVANRHYTK